MSFWFLLLTPHSQSLFFHSLPSSISTPFPAFWTLFSCCFLCLECHPPKLQCQLLCLFRVFWKAWWRQISHSVIQALCIAWGLFCISNVIRKSLTEKWSPLQHPHLEMSSICYKSPQFRTSDPAPGLPSFTWKKHPPRVPCPTPRYPWESSVVERTYCINSTPR